MDGSEELDEFPNKDRRSSTKSATQTRALPSNRSNRRATRACDRCKHKKMRCTGKQPCANCASAGVQSTCSYTAKYTRGRVPPIQVASHNDQYQLAAEIGWAPGAASSKRRTSSGHSSEAISPEPVDPPHYEEAKSRDKEPSTFASAYRRTQDDFSHSATHKIENPVFAYGDPVLPEPDLSFVLLPPLDEARQLVAKFMEVVCSNMRILHQQTIDRWLVDVLQSFRRSGQAVDNARSAIILLIFASSYNYQDTSSEEEDTSMSFRYFQAADDLLKKEKGEIRLESIQARLLQCFYLLSRSRINHAWTVFGTLVSQVFAIQLHRKTNIDRNRKEDLIQAECCKRVFWVAYTLDKYFSLSLGRPEYFNDEIIDQKLPLLVNDENLSTTRYVETRNEINCVMRSPVYHEQMAMILAATLRDLYGIRPPPLEKCLTLSRKHHNSLQLLADANRSFLTQDTRNLRMLFRQQILGAKLSYSHIVTVIFQPFLLQNLSADGGICQALREEHQNNVMECLKAAMDITGYLNDIFELDQPFNGSWFTHYCGYAAVVAIYVYVIKHQSDLEEVWKVYFKAAVRCQAQIKVAAEEGSFVHKSSQILDALYAEAKSHILRKKRHHEEGELSTQEEVDEGVVNRSHEPQYSDQFAIPPVASTSRKPIAEYTYGGQWQDAQFDQTAPGGGILGSMDWIQMQRPSVVDQIEKWGFSSLIRW